jgi:hypothetical protein
MQNDSGRREEVRGQIVTQYETRTVAQRYTGQEIARNELVDIGSIGSNEEEDFSGCIGALLMATIDCASS